LREQNLQLSHNFENKIETQKGLKVLENALHVSERQNMPRLRSSSLSAFSFLSHILFSCARHQEANLSSRTLAPRTVMHAHAARLSHVCMR
jgi:hypothetical protein